MVQIVMNSGHHKGASNMKTSQTFIDPLNAAKAQGFIWNADFKEIKDSASYNFELARRSVMHTIYLGGSSVSDSGVDQELYYNTPSNMHGLQSKKFHKLLDSAGESDLAKAVQELVRVWKPVSDLLVELKPTIKKGRKPSTDPTKTPARTLENTGTCACCGRNVKLTGGNIVDHGFKLKWGWGGRMGSCFGVAYPAVEISDKGLKAVLLALQVEEIQITKRIDNVENDRCSISTGSHRGAGTVAVGDPSYPRYKRNELVSLRSSLHYMEKDIARLTSEISEWKPTPLPMESAEDFGKRCQG